MLAPLGANDAALMQAPNDLYVFPLSRKGLFILFRLIVLVSEFGMRMSLNLRGVMCHVTYVDIFLYLNVKNRQFFLIVGFFWPMEFDFGQTSVDVIFYYDYLAIFYWKYYLIVIKVWKKLYSIELQKPTNVPLLGKDSLFENLLHFSYLCFKKINMLISK